jgi:hypothetical protein
MAELFRIGLDIDVADLVTVRLDRDQAKGLCIDTTKEGGQAVDDDDFPMEAGDIPEKFARDRRRRELPTFFRP